MLPLIVFVISVGLVDSINPSTIAPALYLATGEDAARSLTEFIAGVVSVSMLGGLVLTLGPGQVLLGSAPRPGPHVTHLIELALGATVLLFAVGLWLIRERVARKVVGGEDRSARNTLLLGAGIMAVELPTALPYFAVIAAIIAGDENAATQIFLLLLFNAVFAAPLLLILVIRTVAGQRGIDALAEFRLQLNRRAAVIIPVVAFAAAVALLLLGGIGLSLET